ncbi:MAG: serine/threonine protein kinase [bacterium]|nr:serine/threonine protein kinase [bacterium]
MFDIGEVDGQHFLSMEYIDGEDLSSLIRRIGRLPQDKALDAARQLCAGLAAAHDAGVLHRDLKPANVMIDGRGRARLTDFGLAGLADELRGADAASGTPAYMAPELAGRDATVRSDIYALGLLLHEMFTGRRVWDAATLPELRRQRERGAGVSPSSLVPELDPRVERVIARCLKEEPAERPASALQVASALPGGNPLEEALAAGETPSPAMVAAAPTAGALSLRRATASLLAIVLLLVGLSFADAVNLHHRVPQDRSPEVLADRAAELLAGLGLGNEGAHRAWGVALDESYFNADDDPLPPAGRWRRLPTGQPLSYYFWYRQSPVPLAPGRGSNAVTATNPPQLTEGMARVVTDLRGRLVAYEAVPPARRQPAAAADTAARASAEALLWEAAGLEPAKFTPAPALWTPPAGADEQRAWVGAFADHPDLPLRVETASSGGRVVHFRALGGGGGGGGGGVGGPGRRPAGDPGRGAGRGPGPPPWRRAAATGPARRGWRRWRSASRRWARWSAARGRPRSPPRRT